MRFRRGWQIKGILRSREHNHFLSRVSAQNDFVSGNWGTILFTSRSLPSIRYPCCLRISGCTLYLFIGFSMDAESALQSVPTYLCFENIDFNQNGYILEFYTNKNKIFWWFYNWINLLLEQQLIFFYIETVLCYRFGAHIVHFNIPTVYQVGTTMAILV